VPFFFVGGGRYSPTALAFSLIAKSVWFFWNRRLCLARDIIVGSHSHDRLDRASLLAMEIQPKEDVGGR
jgi:hypothetical protein